MNEPNRTSDPKLPARRKPYTPPKLVSYGHVKDIVQGASGPAGDSGTTKKCWVAEALYGVTDPRTLLLRGWLTALHVERRPGWLLVELYGRCGEAVAGLIRTGWLPGRALRPLFDFLAGKAFDAWARLIRNERHRRAA